MGTEIVAYLVLLLYRTRNVVKLNNPLMGTEIIHKLCSIRLRSRGVKLNNPLMGTETYADRAYISSEAQEKLN